MHRLIRDHLEEVLAGSVAGSSREHADRLKHLHECEECRQEVDAMREHAVCFSNCEPQLPRT